MSVLWGDLEPEIIDTLNRNDFKHGGTYHDYLIKWGNRIIKNICVAIDIREHFVGSSSDLTFSTSDLFQALPSDFLKISRRFTKVRVDDDEIGIIGLDELFAKDPDHSETSDASIPDYVAIEGGRLYVYPLVTATITFENYFRTPTVMTSDSSSVDLPYDEALEDLIINGVLNKAARWLRDWDLYKIASAEYAAKLFDYQAHLAHNASRTRQTPLNY
jgi:hypothetical protein